VATDETYFQKEVSTVGIYLYALSSLRAKTFQVRELYNHGELGIDGGTGYVWKSRTLHIA
jgi:hypothetical protein